MITWVMRRGQIKHLLYEMCLTGRIDRATFCEQIVDLNKVTPVVWCKDCKYKVGENTEYNDAHCGIHERGNNRELTVGDYDYCSWGERKDEVEE